MIRSYIGRKDAPNDVQKLISGGGAGDIFGDTTDKKKSIPAVLDRLAGWYGGSPDKTLRRARDDYVEAILRIGGPWPTSKDQTDIGKLWGLHLDKVWADYNYTQIDAQRALRELGFEVEKKDALTYLQMLLPPAIESRSGDIIPEDPRIYALLQGLTINRADWDLVYAYAAVRSQRALSKLGDKK